MSLPIYELGEHVVLQTGWRRIEYIIAAASYNPDTDVEDVAYRLGDTRTGRLSEKMIPEVHVRKDVLRAEALEACEMRGHKMGPFEGDMRAHTCLGKVIREAYTGTAVCVVCGAWVQVETHPWPNGIEVGGPAVAVSCVESKLMKECDGRWVE